MDFDALFKALTERSPFPWQRNLYQEFLEGRFPSVCDLPTGLGKTSVLAIWLLALAHHARAGTVVTSVYPRRLVYVVNRRTIVDQATEEARNLRGALLTRPELREVSETLQALATRPSDALVAISTLRGQFADNADWRDDPARPAIIVGTVDMIGSRLLFSGYGRGFKSRPLHAAFLAQDALLVHDEAHLEPAFQQLVEAIQSEQQKSRDARAFRVLALTATSRAEGEVFGLSGEDRSNLTVLKRLEARKRVHLHRPGAATAGSPVGSDPTSRADPDVIEDPEKPREREQTPGTASPAPGTLADRIVSLALEYRDCGNAILVFLRKPEDVEVAQGRLCKEKLQVEVLTGTLRGLERDRLASQPAFSRFLPPSDRPDGVEPAGGTVYLICTSAGEVGVNLSADQMICDLTPFDSMAQRFGRVNRFGEGDARIDVVVDELPELEDEDATDYDRTRTRTCALLGTLPIRDGFHDASPEALRALPLQDRLAAFSPPPLVRAAGDILFDAWALTTIQERLPGRPPVADWLHGVSTWDPPVTHVAWREEVEILGNEAGQRFSLEDLLDDFPLKPHELLRDRTDRVFKHLAALARKHADAPAWVVDDAGVTCEPLSARLEGGKDSLANRTVILPPGVGGLRDGLFCGTESHHTNREYDVSVRWLDDRGHPRRLRIWDDEVAPSGMRLVRTLDTRPEADDSDGDSGSERRFWHWYIQPRSADDEGSGSAATPQSLQRHLDSAEGFARSLAARLGLGNPEAEAVVLAARWHDLGKRRRVWQRSIGNRGYPEEVLAKPAGRMRPVELGGYRHELGSVVDLRQEPGFTRLSPETQDLVMHLVAAHHGRARPHFPSHEAFDPERAESVVAEVVAGVSRRFGQLQRRYGRWGLAYLESLVRAADALASSEGMP